MAQKRVMITGVYGLIAGAIYNHLIQFPEQYDVYGLARRRHDSDRVSVERVLNIPDEKFTLNDLSDLDEVIEAFDGMDVVVHMAACERGSMTMDTFLSAGFTRATKPRKPHFGR
jgi:nucleoside-diphosphate-sugar epimerase